MKKNLKRTLAKVMAVALTVTIAGTMAPEADAAKKIKLSKKSITVTKGKTKKVTIKNVKAKKVKKLTVKSSKKKVATVKKSGKTAFKVTGKKAGSAKITVKVTVKGKKKATKLTLKVKVKKGNTPVVTAAPTTVPTAAPTTAPTAAPTASANPVSSSAPASSSEPASSSDPASPSKPTGPVQPAKPSTAAKTLPDMNLREEVATEWSTAGSYGTAIFNTDDTVSFSSQPWALDDSGAVKAGNCYNNGIAWYISSDKGQVDLSAYTDVELTIKTDAEVKIMTWAGSADAADFWSKNDSWSASTGTVENADGSKTITYPLEKIFGNAKKVAKATAIGLTLKSDLKGDDSKFEAKEATIYSIKFVNNGSSEPDNPTGDVTTPTGDVTTPTGDVTTPTGDVTTPTGDVTTPTSDVTTPTEDEKPLVTLDANGYTSFKGAGVDFDATKSYSAVAIKIKAYNNSGDLITADDENYGAFQGYSKLTLGTESSVGDGTANGAGGNTSDYSKTWAMYFLNNLGKYGTNVDENGYFTLNIDLTDSDSKPLDTSYYDGFGFQTTTNAAGVPKIEIYEVTFTEAESESE